MHSDKKESIWGRTFNWKSCKNDIQTLYDKGLFHSIGIADEVLKSYLLIEDNERRRPDLDELFDDNMSKIEQLALPTSFNDFR